MGVIALGLPNAALAFPFTNYECDFSKHSSTTASGTTYDFTGWTGTAAPWSLFGNPASGRDYWYGGNTTGDTVTYNTNFILNPSPGQSWNLGTLVSFKSLYSNAGTFGSAAVVFSNSSTSPTLTVYVQLDRTSSGQLTVSVWSWDGSSWQQSLNSGWLSGSTADYAVQISRPASTPDKLWVSVKNSTGFSYGSWTSSIGTALLNTLRIPGYRVSGANAQFTDLSIQTPAPVWSTNQRDHHDFAHQGIAELLALWWDGDWKNGHIRPTHGGRYPPAAGDDQRGEIWERAELIFAIEGMYRMDADINLRSILKSQWYYDKLQAQNGAGHYYTATDWTNLGVGTTAYALDDATWKLRYLLIASDVTGDPDALAYAEQLEQNVFTWSDGTWGGGLWYNPPHQEKNLVGAAFMVAALQLYQKTGNSLYWAHAVNEDTWIENTLRRSLPVATTCLPAGPPNDGIYWMSYGPDPYNGDAVGIIGGEPAALPGCTGGEWRPDVIYNGGGSVSALWGNMALDVARSLMFQITGTTSYRTSAVNLANAIRTSPLGSSGAYINDRDAFAEGSFSPLWARNVLGYGGAPLAGVSPDVLTALRQTADNIHSYSRQDGGAGTFHCGAGSPPAQQCPVGSYKGDWPQTLATKDQDVWSTSGSSADLLMVSASTVGMMVGASYLP
jgi:hypothetical protein